MRLPPTRTSQPPSEGPVFDEKLLAEVFAYVSRRVRPREEAEDVTAETVQAALSGWHRLRSGDRRLWVLGIARRKTADAIRRKSRRRETALAEEMPAPGRPGQDMDEAEATAQLRAVVLALPKDQREALLLQHLERLSQAEIAVVMGRSPAAVNGLLQRARARAFREGRAYFLEPEVQP